MTKEHYNRTDSESKAKFYKMFPNQPRVPLDMKEEFIKDLIPYHIKKVKHNGGEDMGLGLFDEEALQKSFDYRGNPLLN